MALIRRGLLCLSAALCACGTMNSARPLPQGEHQLGVTAGGALVEFGGSFIPLPNVVVEGRSGLKPLGERALDVNYGLNLTTLAFGIVGVHGGAGLQLSEQRGGLPAVSVSDRLYLYNNVINRDVAEGTQGLFVLDQVDVTASWLLGSQLIYLGLTDYIDFAAPELLLTPFVGASLRRPDARVAVQVEGRWMAITQSKTVDALTWAGGGQGALSLTLGLGFDLGGRP